METTTSIGGGALKKRLATLLVAFALVAGSLLLIQQQADAAPARAAAAVTAQIGGDFSDLFQRIVCPILLALRDAFAGTFIGDFVTPILNQFLVAFGCAPSG